MAQTSPVGCTSEIRDRKIKAWNERKLRLEAIVCQTQSSHRVPKKEGKERKRGGREEVR
jgi:hypothetical protein